jgi:chemotaxis protein MotB
MARKQKHEEHENHERWLVSYADFITLLFAFFVVMYSLSAVNEGKFRVLSESMSAAFRMHQKSLEPIQFGQPSKPDLMPSQNSPRTAGTPAPSNTGVAMPPMPISMPALNNAGASGASSAAGGQERAMREIADKVAQAMASLIEKDLVTVRRFRYWVEVEIKTKILFPSGSALLEPQALPVLKEIAAVLNGYSNRVQVEGFTDNVPIRSAVYPSNWELSAARAMSVVQTFIRDGVRPTRLSLVGFGEYRPIADNATEEGRARNRRVVIVIMSEEDETQRLRDMTTQTAEEPAPHPPVPPATVVNTAPGNAVKALPPTAPVPRTVPAVKQPPAPVVTPPLTSAPGSDRPRRVSPAGMYEIVLPRLPAVAPVVQPIPKPITVTPDRGG